MATIFLWMSLEAGHILPTIKFATDLQRSGHRVVYQCCDALPEELARFGFRSVPFFENLSHAGVERSLFHANASAPQFYSRLRQQFSDDESYLSACTAEIVRGVELVKPDLVLLDGVKNIAFAACNELNDRWRVARIATNLCPITPPEPVIFLCPAAFEIPSRVQSIARYAEPSLFPPTRSAKSRAKAHAAKPLVYVSFGSQSREYPEVRAVLREIVKAASEDRWHFVVNAGSYAHEFSLLSSEALEISRCPPHLETLSRASVMITHGGLGSVKDCIVNEVPMLVIPQKFDQPANADRVVYHHLGRALPVPQVESTSITGALAELIADRHCSESLAEMREVFIDPAPHHLVANICQEILLDRYCAANHSLTASTF